MLHLVNLLPWYFWVTWGGLGSLYVLRWVIKSTKNDPFLMRAGWFLSIVMLIDVVIDNVISGTGALSEYLPIVNCISMPLVVLTVSLIFIGGYQKSMRPDFDPEKRRTILYCYYALVMLFICIGLFFGGFYVYDHFLKK